MGSTNLTPRLIKKGVEHEVEGDILWVGDSGGIEKGSRYDQNTLTICIKFLNNKSKCFFQSKGQGRVLFKTPDYIICIMIVITKHIY